MYSEQAGRSHNQVGRYLFLICFTVVAGLVGLGFAAGVLATWLVL